MEKMFYLSAGNINTKAAFEVNLAGITYPDPNYKQYRKCSELYVAEYVCGGEGTVICGGNEYHIKTGDTYILPAGMEHNYYSDRNNPWTKKWFNVSGTLCKKLISAYGIENLIHFKNISVEDLFDDFFDFCLSEIDGYKKLDYISQSEYGETVYSYILEQKIRTAENLLKNSGLSVKEISDMLKFTDEHYFCNIFKKKRGVTPARYRR